jgi:hypothetical protein
MYSWHSDTKPTQHNPKNTSMNRLLYLLCALACATSLNAQPASLLARRLAVSDPIVSFGKNIDVASMAADETGNLYLLGFHRADLLLDGELLSLPYSEVQTGFLLKIDAQGTPLWYRQLTMGAMKKVAYRDGYVYVGGEVFPSEFGPLVIQQGEPGTGIVTLFANGNRDGFVAKYDDEGQLAWARTYGGMDWLGLEQGEHLNDLAVGHEGTIYITGSYNRHINFIPAGAFVEASNRDKNFFIAALDPQGEPLWADTFDSAVPGNNGNSEGGAIAVAPDGSVYAALNYNVGGVLLNQASVTNTYGGQAGGLLLKYSPQGVRQWHRNIEPRSGLFEAFGLQTDAEGQVYFGFGHVGPALLGGQFETRFFQPDDGILKSALARFTADGQCLWGHSFFCTDPAMAIAPDGSAYFAAALFRNEIALAEDFRLQAPGPHTASLWFKLDPQGHAQWGKLPDNIGQPMSNTNHSIVLDAEQYIYATATFNHPMDFGNGWMLETGYDSPNFDALYWLKLDNTGPTAAPPTPQALPLRLFPNPAQDYVHLQLPEDAAVELWTMQGQLLSRRPLPAGSPMLPLEGLPTGTYLVRAVAGQQVYVGKLAVGR